MLCVDGSKEKSTQRAAIEHCCLPVALMDHRRLVQSASASPDPGQAIDLFHFRSSDTDLSVAARIHRDGDSFLAGRLSRTRRNRKPLEQCGCRCEGHLARVETALLRSARGKRPHFFSSMMTRNADKLGLHHPRAAKAACRHSTFAGRCHSHNSRR